MHSTSPDPTNPIDRSMKILMREYPNMILRLAQIDHYDGELRFEDSSILLPELHADHVCVLDSVPFGIYLEYQLIPRKDLLPIWFAKCGSLTRKLQMPVALVAVYMQRGDYRTFPDRYEIELGGIKTQFHFSIVKLWEYESRIRSGEFIELVPLLVLFEENPSQETVREEIALIKNSELSDVARTELLSVALIVASRQFSRNIVISLFREEVGMIYERGLVDDWLDEREAIGKEEGKIEGKKEGKLETARAMLSRFLTKKFRIVPEDLLAKIETSDLEWCNRLFDKSITLQSLEELNWKE